jgi:hypothetical protein
MLLKQQIVELLSLSLPQWEKLEQQFEVRLLNKAYLSTIKGAGNKEVYDRRKYFKACLKNYSTALKPTFTPPATTNQSKFDPKKYTSLWQSKPWITK